MTPSKVHQRLSQYTGNFTMEIAMSIETGKEPTIIVVNSEQDIIKVRQTLTFVDDNTMLIESYDTEADQPEKKTIQYKLIRNK